MITKCSADWNETIFVELCEKSIQPLESNISVVVPVSNALTRISYGNQYCAKCNHEDIESLISWDVGAICGKAPTGLLKNSTSPSTTIGAFYYFKRNPRKPIVDYLTNINETDKISANAVYDFVK